MVIVILILFVLCVAVIGVKLSNGAKPSKDEREIPKEHENVAAEEEGKLTPSMIWCLTDRYKVPQYMIDWLNYSLDLGRNLNTCFYYASESAANGFPYLCESEEEFELVERYLKSERSATDILMMGIRYMDKPTCENYAHPFKLRYWKDEFTKRAIGGDPKAIELLTSDNSDEVCGGFVTEDMLVKFRQSNN